MQGPEGNRLSGWLEGRGGASKASKAKKLGFLLQALWGRGRVGGGTV